MDTVRLYFRSMKMLLKSHLQYPASFILQLCSQAVMLGGELLAVLLIIDRFDSLNQWSGGDLLFFFGVMSVTFYIMECFARGVTSFGPLVQKGTLDIFLLRPRGVLTQVICYQLDPRRLTAILVGVAAMVMGGRQSGVQWTALKALALTEAIVFGGLVVLGLFFIEAMFSIRSVKSIEVVNALTYGGRSACQYPIDIYPEPLKILFTAVAPFALTIHLPVSYILGKNLFGWPDVVAFLCPLAGGAFFLVMYVLLQFALRYYRSTGS